jgi:hypothetical protein
LSKRISGLKKNVEETVAVDRTLFTDLRDTFPEVVGDHDEEYGRRLAPNKIEMKKPKIIFLWRFFGVNKKAVILFRYSFCTR